MDDNRTAHVTSLSARESLVNIESPRVLDAKSKTDDCLDSPLVVNYLCKIISAGTCVMEDMKTKRIPRAFIFALK